MALMIRSKLFVPGSRPELFEKAAGSAAERALSFDLEDAVAQEKKAEARASVASFLQAVHSVRGQNHDRAGERDFFAPIRSGCGSDRGPGAEHHQRAEVGIFQRCGAKPSKLLLRGPKKLADTRARLDCLPISRTPKSLRMAAEIAAADRIASSDYKSALKICLRVGELKAAIRWLSNMCVCKSVSRPRKRASWLMTVLSLT